MAPTSNMLHPIGQSAVPAMLIAVVGATAYLLLFNVSAVFQVSIAAFLESFYRRLVQTYMCLLALKVCK